MLIGHGFSFLVMEKSWKIKCWKRGGSGTLFLIRSMCWHCWLGDRKVRQHLKNLKPAVFSGSSLQDPALPGVTSWKCRQVVWKPLESSGSDSVCGSLWYDCCSFCCCPFWGFSRVQEVRKYRIKTVFWHSGKMAQWVVIFTFKVSALFLHYLGSVNQSIGLLRNGSQVAK